MKDFLKASSTDRETVTLPVVQSKWMPLDFWRRRPGTENLTFI